MVVVRVTRNVSVNFSTKYVCFLSRFDELLYEKKKIWFLPERRPKEIFRLQSVLSKDTEIDVYFYLHNQTRGFENLGNLI